MSWTIADVRDRLIASGRATADEIERQLTCVDAGAPRPRAAADELGVGRPTPMSSAWAAGRRWTRDSGPVSRFAGQLIATACKSFPDDTCGRTRGSSRLRQALVHDMHQQALVHDMHQILSGWILFVLAIVLAGILALAMFVHALRSNLSERAHSWLVSVPLLIIAGWLIEMLIMG